jgi:hypothetical protein
VARAVVVCARDGVVEGDLLGARGDAGERESARPDAAPSDEAVARDGAVERGVMVRADGGGAERASGSAG